MGIHSIPMPREVDECDAARDYRAKHEPLFEGLEAGRIGSASALNPYPLGSPESDEWLKGWHRTTAARVAAQLRERARKSCDPCTCGGRNFCHGDAA